MARAVPDPENPDVAIRGSVIPDPDPSAVPDPDSPDIPRPEHPDRPDPVTPDPTEPTEPRGPTRPDDVPGPVTIEADRVVIPVFSDQSGRRWRRMRLVLTPLLVLLVAVLAVIDWQVYRSPRATAVDTAALDQAVSDLERSPVVVGQGPMVRVVEVRDGGRTAAGGAAGPTAVDVATGLSVGTLTGDDAMRARGHRHVVQRYGYTASGGTTKVAPTISLTYDDGPDPRYTLGLLDLLSREHVPATFFTVGDMMVEHPDIVRREAREGHLVANHSLTHADLSQSSSWRAHLELVATDRLIRSLTGTQTPLARLPYEGDDEQSTIEGIRGIVRAQHLGYAVSSHDFDTLDWEHATGTLDDIPLPDLDGRDLTVLMHDGGGNRRLTLAYTEKLIHAAKAKGYRFTTMATAQAGVVPASGPVTPTAWDTADEQLAALAFVWPGRVIRWLFVAALVTVGLSAVFCLLSLGRTLARRRRTYPPPDQWDVRVAAVLAAYNEEAVIRRTVEHLLASEHPLTELLVVDDGSTDSTAAIVEELARHHPRLRLVRQPNAGKSAALNRGLRLVDADVVVTLDADTVVPATTVGLLARHFAADADRRLGAVAGVVRVGNRSRNLLTRWQALEYLTQIGVERGAHDALGAITIVPGACAAWRREAVLSVGGFTDETLAEDCDLTLTLHRNGWKVTQETGALAYTEAPEDVDSLLAQRVRWYYGTLQALFKHRDLMLNPRYGWLGLLVLPVYALSVILPLIFLPLTTLMAYLLVTTSGWGALAVYVLVFVGAQTLVAAVAVLVMRESPKHLLMVPVYRVVFEPLRAYLVYTSAFMALKGIRAGWNKLQRTGRLDALVDEPLTTLRPVGTGPIDDSTATDADEATATATTSATDARPVEVLTGQGAGR